MEKRLKELAQGEGSTKIRYGYFFLREYDFEKAKAVLQKFNMRRRRGRGVGWQGVHGVVRVGRLIIVLLSLSLNLFFSVIDFFKVEKLGHDNGQRSQNAGD